MANIEIRSPFFCYEAVRHIADLYTLLGHSDPAQIRIQLFPTSRRNDTTTVTLRVTPAEHKQPHYWLFREQMQQYLFALSGRPVTLTTMVE